MTCVPITLDAHLPFATQVCCATSMTPASATPATRAPTATPTPSMAKPSARVLRGTWGRPATRTWTSARWVSAGAELVRVAEEQLGSASAAGSSRAAGSVSCKPCLCFAGANPCEHAGKCINTQGSFQCQCLQGYSGPRCEIDVNECLSNPCQNDATCLDQIGEFQCICMPGGWAAPWTPASAPSVGGGRAPGAPELSIGLGKEPWEARVPGTAPKRKSLVKIAWYPAGMRGREQRVGHRQPCSALLFPTLLAWIMPRAGKSRVYYHGAACASGPTTCSASPELPV